DDNGNPESTTDALGRTTYTTFDEDNQLTGTQDALGFTTSTVYLASGLIKSQTNANGVQTKHEYDQRGLETKITEAVGTSAERWTTKQYDDAGNLTLITTGQASDSNYAHPSATHFDYDADNRVIHAVAAWGTSLARTTTTEYDENGNVH